MKPVAVTQPRADRGGPIGSCCPAGSRHERDRQVGAGPLRQLHSLRSSLCTWSTALVYFPDSSANGTSIEMQSPTTSLAASVARTWKQPFKNGVPLPSGLKQSEVEVRLTTVPLARVPPELSHAASPRGTAMLSSAIADLPVPTRPYCPVVGARYASGRCRRHCVARDEAEVAGGGTT